MAETILVADDEAPIRSICERLLRAEGFTVWSASTGDEAIACLASAAPDLVISDIRMPGSLDGPALLEKIKQSSPGTDVIMMTGFPSLSTAIPTLKQGAYDYLVKPFDNADLVAIVQRCFQ